ncbi:hypothetical protein JWG42_14315 [Desulfoprunum benzoelyticum]|uniref:Uncharacterized protein n=1 Tax=Desulfoprunum benzoelyticum TaxID=1506996 RepID=A0A840UV55_9BACT|nr:hypothetical protein [Desulfoprunum benzoelyticum]MBB5349575.1 hypothetical protein [Desulfoprunum benzoelyticum]MBM9531331.1 hypothetical protein [Desulfoprunum benzoelyticum]
MALPQKQKKIISNIGEAVQKAAGVDVPSPTPDPQPSAETPIAAALPPSPNKGGRPTPRTGNVVRTNIILNEETAERLTLALAAEQVKRRRMGQKLDKSQLIEELILRWLDER